MDQKNTPSVPPEFAYDEEPKTAFKTLEDVYSTADLFSWVRLGLVPVLLEPSYQFSENQANVPSPQSGSPQLGSGSWFLDQREKYNATKPVWKVKYEGYTDSKGQPRLTPQGSDFMSFNHIIGPVKIQQDKIAAAVVSDDPAGGLGRRGNGLKVGIRMR